jgi:hypothetical protein
MLDGRKRFNRNANRRWEEFGWLVKQKDQTRKCYLMKVRYAILTKGSRIQVLVKPTAKQLRKRGTKGWHLFRTIDSQMEAARLLEEGLRDAMAEIEGADQTSSSLPPPSHDR